MKAAAWSFIIDMEDHAMKHPSAADVIIIGGGVAGISLALRLPPTLAVTLLTKQHLSESNTRYAQGGLAAAVGDADSPASHIADTLRAGAGHCDERAVRVLAEGGPAAVAWLISAGTQFDPASPTAGPDDQAHIAGADDVALGHEAAHSHHRVLHAHGDATGAEIERALVAAVRARPNITIHEDALVTELLMEDATCVGVRMLDGANVSHTIHARAVALANGGAGRLWRRTSNPPGATADGLALAYRAGAALTDLEFAQFHPTVLVPPDPDAPAFLISEAVRGEGAYLRNARGERFMTKYPDAELEPRDVVARAILQEMLHEESDHVWLDLRHLPAETVLARFPTIAATCAEYGIDITRDLIPVAPAAHYFMGGVAVDLDARTTVPGLWAVGEVACTGVHGANRLASNSLLEGVVFAARAAESITTDLATTNRVWSRRPPFVGEYLPVRAVDRTEADQALRPEIQSIMWERVGLYRDAQGLERAIAQLRTFAEQPMGTVDDPRAATETANMLLVAQLIAASALARRESRGAHARRDFPLPDPFLAGHRFFLTNRSDVVLRMGQPLRSGIASEKDAVSQ
jgi:L-aspartate oxidase